MTNRIQIGGMQVATVLVDLVADKIAPGTGVEADAFWAAFEDMLNDLLPKNKALLAKRDDLQDKIDAYHLERKSLDHDAEGYKQELIDIGYLVPEGEDFEITTSNVDPEIATIAGSQLVVPTSNARFALNAANAPLPKMKTDVFALEGFSFRSLLKMLPSFFKHVFCKITNPVSSEEYFIKPRVHHASYAPTLLPRDPFLEFKIIVFALEGFSFEHARLVF